MIPPLKFGALKLNRGKEPGLLIRELCSREGGLLTQKLLQPGCMCFTLSRGESEVHGLSKDDNLRAACCVGSALAQLTEVRTHSSPGNESVWEALSSSTKWEASRLLLSLPQLAVEKPSHRRRSRNGHCHFCCCLRAVNLSNLYYWSWWLLIPTSQ